LTASRAVPILHYKHCQIGATNLGDTGFFGAI
jgi:hypothetical protein